METICLVGAAGTVGLGIARQLEGRPDLSVVHVSRQWVYTRDMQAGGARCTTRKGPAMDLTATPAATLVEAAGSFSGRASPDAPQARPCRPGLRVVRTGPHPFPKVRPVRRLEGSRPPRQAHSLSTVPVKNGYLTLATSRLGLGQGWPKRQALF